MSARTTGWDDVVPIGRALYEAAPTRSIFGTDWPHAHSHNERGGPEEAQLIALLYRFLPIRRRARRCWWTPGTAAWIRMTEEKIQVSLFGHQSPAKLARASWK